MTASCNECKLKRGSFGAHAVIAHLGEDLVRVAAEVVATVIPLPMMFATALHIQKKDRQCPRRPSLLPQKKKRCKREFGKSLTYDDAQVWLLDWLLVYRVSYLVFCAK